MPKVSVVISTYNRAHFVSDAIDSVLNQTFKDLEIVVVDDGSTDNTRQVLEKYGDSIHYVYQENKGRAEARNTGIKFAKGEYIAFLDDDDMWLPQKLEKQVVFLNAHPDIGLVHTFTKVIDEGGKPLRKATKHHLKLYKKAIKMGYAYEGMSQLCIMFLSTTMVRKWCFDKVGLFDPNIPAFEDWDFYLRLALKYPIGTIKESLVKFRQHKTHTSNDEFTQGRIRTSLKHLAILESLDNLSSPNQIRCNFYIHLASAYYIDMQLVMFRSYMWKALKLNPLILFRLDLSLYFFLLLSPSRGIRMIRKFKASAVTL